MAGNAKSDKLKRLVAVQRHVERMAESDLAATTRQRDEVSVSMDNVMLAIGSLDPVHRLFAQGYADRFNRLSNADLQLANLQKMQEMKLLREGAKADRLEDSMKDARAHEQRERDDEAVLDVVDMRYATPASSKLQER
ncbi:hypothetical protein [Rhizobium halophytocola]|uniref:Flagellar FliJ protein n=1 Tax=Rhizobium halophytocola TaxID=735519 RepID=A0ABS4E5G6_9HYPH|nr:hypothetical protein [Rhizobium halophytocola]MBP1853144.1 hypothetical protein [Rhizobium halophytocola]